MREILPFRPGDAGRISLREVDARALAFVPDLPRLIRDLARTGPTFTAWADGQPACIGGVMILTEWMGEAWLFTSPLVERYPLWFHKAVRQYLRLIIAENGLRRVQANVFAENETSLRWTPRLGFIEEGPLYAYGPGGEDYTRFARLRVN